MIQINKKLNVFIRNILLNFDYFSKKNQSPIGSSSYYPLVVVLCLCLDASCFAII